MPKQTKEAMQDSAAAARAAKASLPRDHFKKKAKQRKAKMGPISRQETYPQERLMELAGWGRLAWRRAVESGLEVARHGVQVYVSGEAYFRWIENRAKPATPAT